MQAVTARPIDARHLFLSSLGFLAVFCTELTIHSGLSAVRVGPYVDVTPTNEDVREHDTAQPVCVVPEGKSPPPERNCSHLKEKRHETSAVKTA